MHINVRQEVGDDGSHTTCVWVVGDDGETQKTSYLKDGEQVAVEVGFTQASQAAAVGEVEPFGKDPAQAAPPPTEPPAA